MTSPAVSVVIPTHSRRHRLPRTLGTALRQTAVELEVIVVDDGSTDGTADYVAANPDPRVRLVRHDTAHGLAAARNAGIAVALGEWVAFLDDDDLWAPDKLRSQLAALHGLPGAQWSAVGSVNVDDSLRVMRWARPPSSGDLRGRFKGANVIPGGGSGVLVSAALLHRVGAFDTTLTFVEDLDLWIRLADHSPVASVDRPLVAYVEHGGNLSLAAHGYEAELLTIDDRYRVSGRAASTLALRASNAARRGQPMRAARMVVRAAVTDRDPLAALRAATMPVAHLLPRSARRPVTMPRRWREEAEAWLAGLRAREDALS